MHCKNIFLFAVVFVFAISACKKSGTNPGLSPAPPHTGSDVYVAGFITAKNGHPVAAYWKNGVITKLGDSTLVSEASSIIVQGSDIYVAGISSSINQANTTVTYWKNGVAVRMPLIADLGVSQTAFAINGNDLYMAGDLTVSNQNTANFWKNNVSTSLPDYSAGSYAYGIYSSGPDLYVTGYANIPGGLSTAVYWKNGVLKKLGDETKYQSMGYSIKVSGSDIYVAGYIEHISNNGNTLQAVYWKNGVQTILTDISLAADAFDIVINNNDIYVSGFVRGSFNQPAYWKNGVQTTLDVTNAGTYGRSIVSSIAVDNNDVYVVSGYPRYWKNGVPFQLAKDGGATGIYVVPN